MKDPILSGAAILPYIPQRVPMVMIDRLFHADDTQSRTGFLIESENIFVENGVFTEPGLIENMAQTAAVRAGYYFLNRKEPVPVGFIGAIKHLKINRLAPIGAVIETEATLVQQVMDINVVEGKVWWKEELLASCELKIFVMKNSKN